MGIQQIIFFVLLGIVSYICFRQYGKIVRNIRFGKDAKVEGPASERLKNMTLIALGQKKMFKNMIPALLHLTIYVAFLFTQIELIEIIIDGITGKHRVFANPLGGLYTAIIGTIEILSLLALISTFIFLWRRNMLKIPRFVKPEMEGWPKLDANLILIGEVILVMAIFTMNGADKVLQGLDPAHYPDTGTLPISSWLGPALFGGMNEGTLHFLERFGWWAHILVVFGFLLYLPFSKHLHIIFAFPNTYLTSIKSRGEMTNMPEIMTEVKGMMGLIPEDQIEMSEELPEFGAKDVNDLTWKNILDAYSCTECGRCTAECPANMTGKQLSPRKIMMDVRDRATDIGEKIDSGNAEYIKAGSDEKVLNIANFDDGKSLFDLISKEEINACTTCNACVEACPIMINPMDIILQMRRYEILTESAGPADWTPMFTSLENGGAVWQVPDARDKWTEEYK